MHAHRRRPGLPRPHPQPGRRRGFQVNLNQNSPAYQAAAQACQSLKPGGNQAPQVSSKKLAAEVRWAQYISHPRGAHFPRPRRSGHARQRRLRPLLVRVPIRQPSLPSRFSRRARSARYRDLMTTGSGLAADAEAARRGLATRGHVAGRCWTPVLGVVVMAVAVVVIFWTPLPRPLRSLASPTTPTPRGSIPWPVRICPRRPRCRPLSGTPAATRGNQTQGTATELPAIGQVVSQGPGPLPGERGPGRAPLRYDARPTAPLSEGVTRNRRGGTQRRSRRARLCDQHRTQPDLR